jgi:hypothetical protein
MELDSKERQFSSEYRKKLGKKIEKLTDKKDFVNVFNIIKEELGNEYSSNRNGMFLNLNLLSDETISKLGIYLNENTDNYLLSDSDINTKIKYQPYSPNDTNVDSFSGQKLSNQEKSLIKKINKI